MSVDSPIGSGGFSLKLSSRPIDGAFGSGDDERREVRWDAGHDGVTVCNVRGYGRRQSKMMYR